MRVNVFHCSGSKLQLKNFFFNFVFSSNKVSVDKQICTLCIQIYEQSFFVSFQSLSTARPLVTVYTDKNEPSGESISLPAVFKAPIRPDVVNFVHQQVSKNSRQPYSVSKEAGEQKAFSQLFINIFFPVGYRFFELPLSEWRHALSECLREICCHL